MQFEGHIEMNEKTVLVTGASSGFGKAIAEHFVADGYCVVGTSRSATSDAPIAASGLTMTGLDVCSEASVDAFITNLKSQGINPDIVVLNAGTAIGGAIEDTPTVDVIAQFETNVFGVHRLVRHISPMMRTHGFGRFIFIGSIGGRITIPFQAFYSASKSALSNCAFALRMELMPFNVKVSLIEPGDHKTNISDARTFHGSDGNSAFEDAATRAVKVMTVSERNEASAQSLALVVKRAAESANPKVVYIKVSRTEWLFLFLQKILPDRMFQNLLMKAYSIG